jgi:hypothetical protein
MSVIGLVEFCERYIRALSPADRLRLVTMTTEDLLQAPLGEGRKAPRRIPEPHGPGADAWEGVGAQAYVDSLRDEWDRP